MIDQPPTMSWLGDVLAALETRDAIEQSVKGIVDKC